jgi:hypothetical protein
VESGCIADWRQLHHWGIDECLLPAQTARFDSRKSRPGIAIVGRSWQC